jgi:hypothetical protein
MATEDAYYSQVVQVAACWQLDHGLDGLSVEFKLFECRNDTALMGSAA